MDRKYSTHQDGHFITVPPIDELCAALKRKFIDQETQIDRLKQEIDRLKSEYYKDEELARLKQENETLKEENYHAFVITKEEREAINKWFKELNRKDYKIMYGGTTYEFIETPLGTVGMVRTALGDEFTFRDL